MTMETTEPNLLDLYEKYMREVFHLRSRHETDGLRLAGMGMEIAKLGRKIHRQRQVIKKLTAELALYQNTMLQYEIREVDSGMPEGMWCPVARRSHPRLYNFMRAVEIMRAQEVPGRPYRMISKAMPVPPGAPVGVLEPI